MIRSEDLPPEVRQQLGLTAGRRGNKFGVAPRDQRTHNGRVFDSKAEALRAATLDLLLSAGGIRGYIRQPRFTLGVPENVYVPDFLVFEADGSYHAEDVKGVETAKFKRDRKLWRRYGPCPLVVLFNNRREVITPEKRDGNQSAPALPEQTTRAAGRPAEPPAAAAAAKAGSHSRGLH